MKWIDAITAAQRSDNRKVARVVALGWVAVDVHGDEAAVSTLTMNAFDPFNFAVSLDLYGVPTPPNLGEVSGYKKPELLYVSIGAAVDR